MRHRLCHDPSSMPADDKMFGKMIFVVLLLGASAGTCTGLKAGPRFATAGALRHGSPLAAHGCGRIARVAMSVGNGNPCVIRVLGVGGGGSNAVTRMMRAGQPGVECFSINTDAQALEGSPATSKQVQIGRDVTRGLGAGGNPAIGRLAAEESVADINAIVQGADLVFVVAGMGGGTGSGAAPVVAECAKLAGCLTVGVVTKPFLFEGARRMRQAVEAIQAMREATDALIVVSNDKLLASAKADLPIDRAFEYADDVLRQGVAGGWRPCQACHACAVLACIQCARHTARRPTHLPQIGVL